MNFMNNVFRFAPSPTGHLHLGGLRTALFNFVYAKKLGASFKLRIDDTDSARLVPGSVDSILEDLDWAGIQFDPPHPVWRQSDRYHIYRSMAEQLVLKGFAYRCYCSGACTSANCTQNQPSVYHQGLSGGSFITCGEQNKAVGKRTENSYAIRLFTSRMIEILQKGNLLTFHDLIYGPITVDLRLIGSPVLLKSNGAPTYHLCGPIDDHDMGVTTVMRGQEWLPSTPLHILVYLAFNWDPPKFAHLPLLCDIHGKKLSKRNNHSFVSHYRKHGIVPQALLNFLMLQGWSLGSSLGPKEGTSNPIFMQKSNDFDKNKVFESMVPLNEGLGDLVRGKSINEVHTIDEIIPHFNIEKINRADARVDFEKLKYFNRHHILRSVADGASDEAVKLASQLSTAIDSNEKLPKNLYPNSESKNSTSLHSLFEENLDSPKFTTPGIVSIPNVESCDEFKKKGFSNQYLVDCIRLLAGRVDTVEKIAKSAKYLFETPQRVVFDSQKDLEILEKLSSLFSTTNSIDIHQVRSIISDTSSALNMKESRVRKVCRMALTGTSMGAAIDETILVLGLAECIKRFFRCVRDFHSGS